MSMPICHCEISTSKGRKILCSYQLKILINARFKTNLVHKVLIQKFRNCPDSHLDLGYVLGAVIRINTIIFTGDNNVRFR